MANEKATIQDLAERLAARNRCSRTRADMFLRKMFNQIKSGLATDSFVKVKGLGTFKLVTVNSRTSVDVNTGEKIEISEHQRLVFTPDNSLKERVNKPFEKFETVKIEDDDVATGLDLPEEEYKAVDAVQDGAAEPEWPAASQTTGKAEPAPLTPAEADTADKPAETDAEKADGKEQETKMLECQTVYIGDHEDETNETDETAGDSGTTENRTAASDEPDKENTDLSDNSTSEDQCDDNRNEETGNGRKLLYIPLAVIGISILVIASYIAGYYHIFDSGHTEKTAIIPACSVITVEKGLTAKPATHDSLATEAGKAENEDSSLLEQSKSYRQMENGDYLIAGTLTVHKLKIGDTLLKLSKKTYGSPKLVQYIVFYNNLENPDCIQLGMELKLPKLIDKETGKEPEKSKET